MEHIEQEDNGLKGRFAIYDNDVFAGEMTYTWAGQEKFIIDHTGVEDAFGGRSMGKKMVLSAVEFARKNNLKIIPLCPFAKRVFDKDTEIRDVLL